MSDVTTENCLNLTVAQTLRKMQHSILHSTTYFGIRTFKSPMDAWVYQEIIVERQPDVIIEIGNKFGGSALMLAHWLDQIGKGRVVGVDIDHSKIAKAVRSHPRIALVEGDSCGSIDKVRALLPTNAKIMVIEDSLHTYAKVASVLATYSGLVTKGDYFIVEDCIINHGLVNAGNPSAKGPYEAVEEFVARNPAFHVDRTREHFALTWNPGGYLKRVAISEGKAITHA